MSGAEEVEVCDYCCEPVSEHTVAEWRSCQADLRAVNRGVRLVPYEGEIDVW